jgi:acetolactate synthase-1/2/3 large subunit
MLNGAQVIVDYLIQEKVPQVFGLCGHGNIQFIDALYERSSDIKTISVHHESVAGFMADVYYRVSGRPTATFTSCGPGSANLPISLANAFLDSVPFLAVTGNVPTSQFNRGAFQEMYRHYQADFPSTVRTMCKKVFQPTRGEMVPLAVRQAWKTMTSGRPGPVVLDVPFDVFMESAAEEAPNAQAWNANISSRCGADPEGVVKAVDMLLGAERPTIIVGQGVRYEARRAAANPGRGVGERLGRDRLQPSAGAGSRRARRALSGQPRDASGGCLAGDGNAVRRPYLELVDPRLLLHHPADAADPCRHRPRGDRPQLSRRAWPDGRRSHFSAADTCRTRSPR